MINMRSRLRYFAIGVFLMTFGLVAAAQGISVSAPARVSVGENFRISYTVSPKDVDEFRSALHTTDVVEVIAGPYTSQQSSFQMVNGHTSSSSSITYTYTLYAAKNGVYNVGPAHARMGGRSLSSRAIKVVVSGNARSSASGAPRMHNDEDDGPQMRASGSRISGSDLFIKVNANKRHVHEQEPILLTYKVYTLVDLSQLDGKMPDLTGFHTQEVPLPQQKSFHVERVNGRNYRCVTWSQYIMYPQMTGKLTIPSITFKGIVVEQNRNVDPFEAFFNGGSGYTEVKRNIVAPSLTVQVDPLPAKPADFSGGVGKFNISASIDHNSVKAGEPINLRVVVGGIGNLKLIKQPMAVFPKDFDKYDPKVTDKTRLTANGVEGNMVYDFLVVPRNQGKYTIPAVAFTYYDTGANAYRTIKTQPFDITVAQGDGKKTDVSDYSSDEDKDIHALKLGDSALHATNDFFFGSTAYWVSLILPLLAFVLLLIVFRKRAVDNADVVKMRGKKANRVATRRLKKAGELMLKGRQNEFYDEVLRALWGYVSDKMSMPAEKLSRENIEGCLADRGVDESTIKKFISALDECEFERYAPGDVAGNMNKTFESAMTAIMNIEDAMKVRKSKKRPSSGAMLLFLLAFCLIPVQTQAVTKANADAEYNKGNYQQAIKDYEDILKHGVSADVYYNLGNAYYRTDNITQAVLAYERALRLSPGDKDIRFNLQFVRAKTIDKITPASEMFFVTWFHALVNFTSVDRWATVGSVSIILALLLVLVYLFAPRMILRKVGFYGAAVLLLVFILGNFFAFEQKRQYECSRGAIVTAPSVTVKKTPSASGSDAFVLHEGTRVDITDTGIKGWRGIQLADGREGWIPTSKIENI